MLFLLGFMIASCFDLSLYAVFLVFRILFVFEFCFDFSLKCSFKMSKLKRKSFMEATVLINCDCLKSLAALQLREVKALSTSSRILFFSSWHCRSCF